MPPKVCRVSFADAQSVEHAVEVLADSLFEAAGLGSGPAEEGRLGAAGTGTADQDSGGVGNRPRSTP
jgi:hypothetical protein